MKGLVILFLAAVNELKLFSGVMLMCQLSVHGKMTSEVPHERTAWSAEGHRQDTLQLKVQLFCPMAASPVFPLQIFLLALKPWPWCAGL